MVSFEIFIDIILPASLWSLVSTQSLKRNGFLEYFLRVKGGRCVGLTTLSPSCRDCYEIWEPRPPRNLWASPGLCRNGFAFGKDRGMRQGGVVSKILDMVIRNIETNPNGRNFNRTWEFSVWSWSVDTGGLVRAVEGVVAQIYKAAVSTGLMINENRTKYEGWNFNSGNYLFTTDTK